jgi:hypothetical protein
MTGVTVRPGWAVVPRKAAWKENNELKITNYKFSELRLRSTTDSPKWRPKTSKQFTSNPPYLPLWVHLFRLQC